MKKGLKKVLSLTMVLGAIISAGSSTYAANPGFEFILNPGVKDQTVSVRKEDSEQKAYVTVKSSDSTSKEPMYFRVRTSTGSMATDVKAFVGYTGRFTLPYTILYGQAGSNYKLWGQADSDADGPIYAFGNWNA